MESELSPQLDSRLTKYDLLRKCLWAGNLLSFCIYLILAVVITRTNNAPPTPPAAANALLTVFALASLGLLALLPTLRRSFFAPAGAASYLAGRPGWLLRRLFAARPRTALPKVEYADSEQKLWEYSLVTLNPQMMTWGLANTIGIFGIMVTLVTRQLAYAYLFVIVGAIATALLFPNLKTQLRRALYLHQTGVTE